ncbi:hypothetical protein [Nostoc sp.]
MLGIYRLYTYYTLVSFVVAVGILQLIQGRDNPNLPATVAFSHEQQQ